ncbi:MAG: sigma-70 family RNA polymerase sigma factor [Phycisphaeraceae bacterium]|nr:sigma-70 family RNA polymerase sigma factor [Phycisphaeraceae bacterium]
MSHPPDTQAAASLPGDWTLLRRRLLVTATSLTGRAEEADELVQEALTRILVHRPEAAYHAGYARQVLTRCWLDRQRSMRRRAARLLRMAHGFIDRRGAAGAPQSSALAEDTQALIRAAVDRLPPRQRAVLVLRLVEDLPYPAIAEALDTTVASVRASLHLARAAMRASLPEDSAP